MDQRGLGSHSSQSFTWKDPEITNINVSCMPCVCQELLAMVEVSALCCTETRNKRNKCGKGNAGGGDVGP